MKRADVGLVMSLCGHPAYLHHEDAFTEWCELEDDCGCTGFLVDDGSAS